MPREFQFNPWMRSQLRRAFYRSGRREIVFKRQRVGRNQYRCEGCGEVFHYKEIKVDHIIPIIDPTKGFTNWDDFISRLFCGEKGLQGLCDPCHDKKSALERDEAVERRRKERSQNDTKVRLPDMDRKKEFRRIRSGSIPKETISFTSSNMARSKRTYCRRKTYSS